MHADELLPLAVGVLLGAVVGVRLAGDRDRPWYRKVAIVLTFAHIGAVLGVTLFPLGAGVRFADQPPVALEPLRTIRLLIDGPQSLRQLGGNLLLLAPMGVLVPIAWRRARPWRWTLLWGLATSVAVEAGQLALQLLDLSDRVVDVDDVLLNVLGVAAGRLVFAVVHGLWRLVTRAG